MRNRFDCIGWLKLISWSHLAESGEQGGLALNQHFHIPDLRRITLFVGAYGSGKSEVSVNFALWQASLGLAVTLCDLDTINPFFRSADARKLAETHGVRLIAPVFAGTNVDVPAVPGEVHSVFDDVSRQAVLDIGGEDLGARVVASLQPQLIAAQPAPALYMVVNPFRPFTQTIAQIVQVAEELMAAAKLPLSGLVHNANLLQDGDASLLDETLAVVQAAAAALRLPIVFAAAMDRQIPPDWPAGRTPGGLPLLRLQHSIDYRLD